MTENRKRHPAGDERGHEHNVSRSLCYRDEWRDLPRRKQGEAKGKDTLRQRVHLWAFTWAVDLGVEGVLVLALGFCFVVYMVVAAVLRISPF